MPSHPKGKIKPVEETKHAGGPLKRKSSDWDSVIGPSINIIPCTQLPLLSTVLQRYRYLRIEDPLRSTKDIAICLATEVLAIWDKARVPTRSFDNCVKAIEEGIESWKKCHNRNEISDSFKAKLSSLLDLKPKLRGRNITEEAQLANLREEMRMNSRKEKRKSENQILDWETDYNFYVDQFKVNAMTGQMSEKNIVLILIKLFHLKIWEAKKL